MELNRKQVKQALKSCVDMKCEECAMPEGKGCAVKLYSQALNTIIKQEAEYNELYELCESYRIERDAIRGAAYSYKLYVKTLEKENETLKTLLDESYDTQNSLTEENERLREENHKKQ